MVSNSNTDLFASQNRIANTIEQMETGDPLDWDLTSRGEVFRDWHLALIQGGASLRLPRMADVVRDLERRIWELEEHADVNRLQDKGKGRAMDVDDEVDELVDEGMDETPRDKGKGRAVEMGLNDPPVSNKPLFLCSLY